MLSINARMIARFPWPDRRGQTVLFQADTQHGGGFFLHTHGPRDDSVGACTREDALRWMANEGVEQIAEPRPAGGCSEILNEPGQRKRAP
jgi:hypothetical protein